MIRIGVVGHGNRISDVIRNCLREIQRLGKKAVLIYFGGIAGRVEQICSIGADALIMETSMKGYRNDLAEIAEKVRGRMALFGNIDPVGILERGSDEQARQAIRAQVRVDREKCKGFIVGTGSPVTPATPLFRVQHFIKWARAEPCGYRREQGARDP